MYKTKYPTPVFNTPSFPLTAPLNRAPDGRILSMETILFPESPVQVEEKNGMIWKITTPEYTSSSPIYVDSHFLEPAPPNHHRTRILPSKKTLLEGLEKLQGTRYFWGGNWPEGIPQTAQFYPPLDPSLADDPDYYCRGVDCSGLLYFLTNGMTPRNTSDLISYGENIPLTGSVKPLDLVVWKGHVLIALSETRLIESVLGKGVVTSTFKERFEEIQAQLSKENKPLFIRRWHPSCL